MESEASSFESSETLAAFVASTPLLEESWKACGVADASVDSHFAVIKVGRTAYVAFSGIKLGVGVDQSCRNLLPLPDELFSGLCMDGTDNPPMVHAGLLHLFQSVCTNNFFRNQELNSEDAKKALKEAKKSGRTRNLNSAILAIDLSKINPLRAQIEWYKVSCDKSSDQMGYYDSYKQRGKRGASKRDFKVNMNRIRLAKFWDSVIDKWEKNQLPYDFHKRAKWVNASQFYKLLVEPLDIAEYYRSGLHHVKGHYMKHGRERRYKIFDTWWNDGEVENGTAHTTAARSRFASSTQDSCFWAKVEEARDRLIKVRAEADARKFVKVLEDITKFDQYARRLIENKEVSIDVLAKNSSYTLFIEEWKEFQSKLQLFQPHFPGILEVEMVP